MAANAASIVGVLHKVIDGLGAGFDHLHDELEQGKYEPEQPAPSADEIAAAQALLARVNPAPAAEAEV